MRQVTTLRTRLMWSFIIAAVVPAAIATIVAVPWFRNSINTEATRTLTTNANVASELFAERSAQRLVQAAGVARVLEDAGMPSGQRLQVQLAQQSKTLTDVYVLRVDEKGYVRGTTTPGPQHPLAWPLLRQSIESKEATSFVAVIPDDEVKLMGLADDLQLKVKETDGGSAAQSEAEGALAVVGVAPVKNESGRVSGAIVVVENLKLENGFVDSVASKLGGVATVFQNGVRVATTVLNDAGERAVGTAISDKVRAASLETGEPFTGEAFVVNRPYLASYQPIKDPTGATIGLLFVGIDKAPYQAEQRNFAIAMAALTLLGLFLAITIAYFGSAQLSAPIIKVVDAAEQVARGDLTARVPEDVGYREARAMGTAFNTMVDNLRGLLKTMGGSASSLDAVSRDIASAATAEADSATSQASAVSEATATLEELNRSFGAVADGARRVLDIAEDSLEVAESGREAVEGGTEHVERLASGATSVLSAAGQLNTVAEDIGQITVVISSIAEQTKILALNAAIEAARAGAAGKGFGVVATEIRTLADSVSHSIGRIGELVTAIQASSRDLAGVAERQATLGQTTVSETLRTRDSFDVIYERMSKTAEAAREIATAAAQQRAAAHQVVEVMHQVSEGVSGTATSARQVAEAARDVEREAGSLTQSLTDYRTH